MLQGVIFDLGSTLLSHQYSNRWSELRPAMIASLLEELQTQGLSIDAPKFAAAFTHTFVDFDGQRQTHFKEITTEYVLRAALQTLAVPPNGLDFARCLAAYFSISEAMWTPMPHVYETIETLRGRGLRLAIVSNAADDANVQRIIDNHRLRPWFDPIVVSAAAGIRKPNPRIFEPVLAAWALRPAQVVMIGDTLGADILGAHNAGMKSIWVTMEAGTPDNEAHRHTIIPGAVAASLAEIPALLEKL
jgi:HAD superfamily hydrolase (TIGR01662 family)